MLVRGLAISPPQGRSASAAIGVKTTSTSYLRLLIDRAMSGRPHRGAPRRADLWYFSQSAGTFLESRRYSTTPEVLHVLPRSDGLWELRITLRVTQGPTNMSTDHNSLESLFEVVVALCLLQCGDHERSPEVRVLQRFNEQGARLARCHRGEWRNRNHRSLADPTTPTRLEDHRHFW